MMTAIMRAGLVAMALLMSLSLARPAQCGGAVPFVLVFDASGSMNERVADGRKIDLAKQIVKDLLADLPHTASLGVVVYGHRRQGDCSDIEVVEPPGPVDDERIANLAGKVAALEAMGQTPIAKSLLETVPLFGGQPGRIILVTDGKEECGGDLCAAAAELAKSGVGLRVDIIGFGLTDSQRTAFDCVTSATGGRYHDARDGSALRKALAAATDPVVGRSGMTVCITEGRKGKVHQPMIKVTDKDGGSVSMVDNPAVFRLAPGTYRITARVGNEPECEPVTTEVREGMMHDVEIDIGTGTLNVELAPGGTGSFTRVPLIQLFREGQTQCVAGATELPARFQANAGRYRVSVGLSSGQTRTFEGVEIVAGEVTKMHFDIPSALITFSVRGGKYTPGSAPYPRIEIRRDGQLVTAVVDNPARYQLLEGAYTVNVNEPEVARAEKTIEVRPGEDAEVVLEVP